jgi:hypothetical protein
VAGEIDDGDAPGIVEHDVTRPSAAPTSVSPESPVGWPANFSPRPTGADSVGAIDAEVQRLFEFARQQLKVIESTLRGAWTQSIELSPGQAARLAVAARLVAKASAALTEPDMLFDGAGAR